MKEKIYKVWIRIQRPHLFFLGLNYALIRIPILKPVFESKAQSAPYWILMLNWLGVLMKPQSGSRLKFFLRGIGIDRIRIPVLKLNPGLRSKFLRLVLSAVLVRSEYRD